MAVRPSSRPHTASLVLGAAKVSLSNALWAQPALMEPSAAGARKQKPQTGRSPSAFCNSIFKASHRCAPAREARSSSCLQTKGRRQTPTQ